jgi:hypothetical protein
MNARILTVVALTGVFCAAQAGAAPSSGTGPYSPPTYTPAQGIPTYQPKVERPQAPKTYTPTAERPHPPSTYTPSGPTFTIRH